MGLPSFTWKNQDSWQDYGIIINELPATPKAQKKVNIIEIEGRDGELTIDTNSYKAIPFTIKCTLLDMTRIDEVKDWLEGYDKLMFSWLDDRFYNARSVDAYAIEQTFTKLGEFTISFTAEPFAYDYNSSLNPFVITTQNVNIRNGFTYYSNPIITVNGTGNITLNIGSQVVSLINVDSYVVINTQLQDCYKDGVLKNNTMVSGDFPILNRGSNIITYTGAVSSIVIQPNFRWL